MSREIKFRAWSEKRHRYYKIRRIEFDLNRNATHVIVWEEDYLKFNIEHLIIEQYTGLKDKNGVEIYEGDIVKWGHLNNEEKTHRIAIVEMYPDIQFHLMKNDVVFKFGSFAYQDTENHLEVIGNIHEIRRMKMSKADKMLLDLGYKTAETEWGSIEMVKDRYESMEIRNGYHGEVYIGKNEIGESAPFTLEEFIAVNEKLKEEGYIK